MEEIVHTPASMPRSGSRLEFETLISDLSSKLINLPPVAVDGEIEAALGRVCELLDIDYAVLWQWSAAVADAITPTHAFPARGGPQPPEAISQEQYPWLVQQMRAGHLVVLSSLDDLPAEAAVDLKYARLGGIKSSLCLPLHVGGETLIGALAFNAVQTPRGWPDPLVKRLQLIAQVFANALARQRADEVLRESEERRNLAADAAGAGLWAIDYGSGVIWATARTRSMFGFTPDEVVTLERLQSTIHPDDRGPVREALERSARSRELADVECRVMTDEGRDRWVLSRGRSHLTSAGVVDRVTGVSIDISERKREQQALVTSEARLASAAELAGLAFYEVDYDEGSMYTDDRLRDLCGVPPDRVEGLGVLGFWMAHLHPDDRPQVLGLRRRLHEGERDHFSHEYRYLHPDRGELWVRHLSGTAARDAAGRAVRTYGVLRDITERKRVEDERHDLSRRLISVQEEERALLARELHDDVSQRLAVLAIDAGRAELAAEGAQAVAMQAVREGLVRLSDDIHSLAYQLHPSILEELGLAEALRAEGERRARRGQLDVAMDLEALPPVVPVGAALCLFRVAQEALNNVAQHARARAATVTLRQVDGGLLLAVSDDGAGFDPGRAPKGMHLGLAGMRERTLLAGGTLDIESAPGQGTKVIAWVPVDGEGPA